MLVNDQTQRYSPLGMYAGRVATPQQYGDFGTDWGSLISGIGTAVEKTVSSVTDIVKTAQAGSGGTSGVVGTVSPGGSLYFQQTPPPQQAAPAAVPTRSFFSDPLMLGVVGLGALGIGMLVFGRRGGRMNGLAGYRRRRRRR